MHCASMQYRISELVADRTQQVQMRLSLPPGLLCQGAHALCFDAAPHIGTRADVARGVQQPTT